MSHYFSRIRVTAKQPEQLVDILRTDEYRLHQLFWDLFPDAPDASRDFLYRRDEDQGWPVFYLLSEREPRTTSLTLEIETKPFDPKLRRGDRLTFSLRANPVRTRKAADGNPKKRIRDDVVMHLKKKLKAQNQDVPSKVELTQMAGKEWLSQRAEKNGFTLEAVRADSYQQHSLRRKGSRVTFSTVDFHGVLTVQAPQAFLQSLFRGIGPAKAFGCGLMLIRRAN